MTHINAADALALSKRQKIDLVELCAKALRAAGDDGQRAIIAIGEPLSGDAGRRVNWRFQFYRQEIAALLF